ncbi:sigma-70 family RNA polymerase sigma factor [Ensifer sp. ZNC0028]|uniref:sigma-70 family RNA polymerase sigma factor n=1 Tax=Ensifer sp. ZNC0028 TaxID=1339236 RepID=UPI000A754300|nr:sigma-70 family RNA polymerase sigma factor [Ensifer sp. ZNC0028]
MVASSLNHWLGLLFRRHHKEVVRYASRLIGNRDDGEEVVQNAYLRMVRVDRRSVEHPRSYLFKAARNAAIDFRIKLEREWSRRVELDQADRLSSSDDFALRLEFRDKVAALSVLLNELPIACRTAFIMNKVEGHSHREIAETLGISVSMVEKHMLRALCHCRDVRREMDHV